MEKLTKKGKLPKTDSVRKLAAFWQKHDLTDFSGDLQEVTEPVFARPKVASVSVELSPAEVDHLRKIARARGVKEATVLRHWIVERLHG